MSPSVPHLGLVKACGAPLPTEGHIRPKGTFVGCSWLGQGVVSVPELCWDGPRALLCQGKAQPWGTAWWAADFASCLVLPITRPAQSHFPLGMKQSKLQCHFLFFSDIKNLYSLQARAKFNMHQAKLC